MDKKTKKKLDVLRRKLQVLRQQLSGARKQTDDPADLERLSAEVAAAEAEIERLKGA